MQNIPNELKTFRDTVSSGIGNMNSTLSTLSGNLDKLSTACTTAQSGFSSAYNSANKNAILTNFTSLTSIISKISSSLNGDMKSILTKSDTLIKNVNRLEELYNSVAAAENDKAIEMAKEPADRDNTRISNDNRIISNDSSEFNTLLPDTQNLLNEIKSMDKTIDIGEAASVGTIKLGEVTLELKNLKEGTYNKVVYTGKNGRKITTYIYLPEGASTTTGLATTLYFPGSGQEAVRNGALSGGLGANLRSGKQYDGIIVICEAEDDKSYSNPDYLDTVKELSDNLVTTYNADSNKISCSGFSYGGSCVQHMAERFPDYFSTAVIVAQGFGAVGRESGNDREAGWEKLRKTKFLLICGDKDPIFGEMQTIYNNLNKGGDVKKIWVSGMDHNFAGNVPITIDGVKYNSYIDYIFTQTRN